MVDVRSGAPRSGALRVVRAGALGVVSLVLAAGAHLAAGGAVPGALPGSLLVAGVVLVAALLTRARLGFPVVLLALALGQVALHHLLGALAVPAPPLAGATGAVSGHHHGAGLGVLLHGGAETGGSSVDSTPVDGAPVGPGAVMLVLHVLATLVSALVLARGEAALWALLAWCRPPAPSPRVLVPVVRARTGWAWAAPLRDGRRPVPAAPRGPPSRTGSVLHPA